MPLALFPRQRELLRFLDAKVAAREDGLVEKSRDIGFNWVVGAWAIHKWLFAPGFKTAFGSRKQDFVDRRGDPDSIFEKLRMVIGHLPGWMLPENFGDAHDNHMRLINPENGNVITGEAGDDMGRGGRSSVYILDEFAFVEQDESVDKSTSGNSETRIFGSSVNGMGNLFARKRHGGALRPDQIFRFHYTDDPRKTPEWAAKKKRTMEAHAWASEYDIDYSASVEGICIPARYVNAAVTLGGMYAEGKIKYEPPRRGVMGLDVGAGKNKSVAIPRFGALVLPPAARGDPDTTQTAHWALELAKGITLERTDKHVSKVTSMNYDSVGVGHDVQYALKATRSGGIRINPTNTGDPPSDMRWPDGESSEDKFLNLKAEGWWKVRARAKCSYEKLQWINQEKDEQGQRLGKDHPLSDCLILPTLSSGPDAQLLAGQLSLPKWFRNEKGKIQIETKQQLATRQIESPDHADALILTECVNKSMATWEKLAGA